MLKRRKRTTKTNFGTYIKLPNLLDNYLLILLIFVILVALYSIVDYNFLNKKQAYNVREHNLGQIRKYNLKELYNHKNLNHNEVRIWILNNTNQRGLAAKVRDCFEKGYTMENKKIKGDYSIFKQDNFKKNDKYDLGRINPNNTQIFVHVDIEQNPKFKTHIQEFLSFTGYSKNIIEYEYNWKLLQERDITIVLGSNWSENSNLNYCKEPIN